MGWHSDAYLAVLLAPHLPLLLISGAADGKSTWNGQLGLRFLGWTPAEPVK